MKVAHESFSLILHDRAMPPRPPHSHTFHHPRLPLVHTSSSALRTVLYNLPSHPPTLHTRLPFSQKQDSHRKRSLCSWSLCLDSTDCLAAVSVAFAAPVSRAVLWRRMCRDREAASIDPRWSVSAGVAAGDRPYPGRSRSRWYWWLCCCQLRPVKCRQW